jgi:hypothetical protein
MATFSIAIPDDQVTRIASALCQAAGLTPVSADNARLAVIQMIAQTVVNVETARAQQAAIGSIAPISPPTLS